MRGYHEKTVLEPEFPFRLFIDYGDHNVPHHWHEDIEILYIVKDSVRINVENNMYNLKQGDIFIIAPGEVHNFINNNNNNNVRIVIQFRASIYENVLSRKTDKKVIESMLSQCHYLNKMSPIHSLLEIKIDEIMQEFTLKEEGYKLMIKAKLYELATIILRHMPRENFQSKKVLIKSTRLERLDYIIQYVEENYQHPISLDNIANEAGFSKYHFTRFFKENMGMTFVDYLTNFRLAKAEWYLVNGEDSVIDVAFKAGFNSVKTFNRVFKNSKGCTPLEYKKIINE